MKKPPSLWNNNGTLQVRVRIDGMDGFINPLGRWSDPVAVAKAQAISAQIWSDYQQGTFDRYLMAYQQLVDVMLVCLLKALRAYWVVGRAVTVQTPSPLAYLDATVPRKRLMLRVKCTAKERMCAVNVDNRVSAQRTD